jgi:hypothetical protein
MNVVYQIAYLLDNDCVPLVLCTLIAYTMLVEVIPKSVTRLNSNAYTSQVRWNVTLKGLRFQLVNYILYHKGVISQVVHGLTFIIDAVLWSIYFHCMLEGHSLWGYLFIFFACMIQTLTFDDVRLKITLILFSIVLLGVSAVAYHVLRAITPDRLTTGYISVALLINATCRVVSHFSEDIPIDYLWLKNERPISNWMGNAVILRYFVHPRIIVAFSCGLFSELQAGVPIRLWSSCLIMIFTKLNFKISDEINMKELHDRADNITRNGWSADADGRSIFKIQTNNAVTILAKQEASDG